MHPSIHPSAHPSVYPYIFPAASTNPQPQHWTASAECAKRTQLMIPLQNPRTKTMRERVRPLQNLKKGAMRSFTVFFSRVLQGFVNYFRRQYQKQDAAGAHWKQNCDVRAGLGLRPRPQRGLTFWTWASLRDRFRSQSRTRSEILGLALSMRPRSPCGSYS